MSESVTGRNMISDQKNGQVKRSNELERGTVVSETSKVVNSARRDAAGIYRPRSLLLFTSHSEFFSSYQSVDVEFLGRLRACVLSWWSYDRFTFSFCSLPSPPFCHVLVYR